MHKFYTNFFILLIGERYMDVDLRDSGIELLRGKNHCTIKKLNYITHQEKICSYQCIPSIPKETEGHCDFLAKVLLKNCFHLIINK